MWWIFVLGYFFIGVLVAHYQGKKTLREYRKKPPEPGLYGPVISPQGEALSWLMLWPAGLIIHGVGLICDLVAQGFKMIHFRSAWNWLLTGDMNPTYEVGPSAAERMKALMNEDETRKSSVGRNSYQGPN